VCGGDCPQPEEKLRLEAAEKAAREEREAQVCASRQGGGGEAAPARRADVSLCRSACLPACLPPRKAPSVPRGAGCEAASHSP
jgi:hypothetical protein